MSWLGSIIDAGSSLLGITDSGASSWLGRSIDSLTNSSLGDIFSSKGLEAALGTFGASSSASEKNDAALEQQKLQGEQTMEQLKYKYDREFELAKLKLSSGSGGGSGQNHTWAQEVAQQNALEKYRRVLEAQQNRVNAVLTGGANTSNAYANMAAVAQAPLTKRSITI